MSVTIVEWDKQGNVGQPLRVVVRRTSGRPTAVRVWLSDGAGESMVLAERGMEFDTLVLYPIPLLAGLRRVWASADDVCENHNETGVIRTTVIQ